MWITESPTSSWVECGQFPRLCTELSTIDPREIACKCWYTALRAIIAGIFHISTVIHSVAQDFGGAVMHSHPQCAKVEDGCGYPTELSTSGCVRILIHRLSRGYPPLIHELSTILWIKGISEKSARCRRGSDILKAWIRASSALRSVTRLMRRRSYFPVVELVASVFGRFGVEGRVCLCFGLRITNYASRSLPQQSRAIPPRQRCGRTIDVRCGGTVQRRATAAGFRASSGDC